MNKKLKTLFGVLLLTVIFCGCGTTKENTEIEEKGQSQGAVYQIGDIVNMGTYEQDNDMENGTEPIEWLILDIEEDKALLLSKYILCSEQYDYSSNSGGSWERSTIYSWLNNDFMNDAFTEEEKNHILFTKENDSELNVGYVFFLSFDEAVEYFHMSAITETNVMTKKTYDCYYSQDALAIPTAYAMEDYLDADEMTQDTYNDLAEKSIVYDEAIIGNTYARYWLRSKAEVNHDMYGVV